MSEPYCFGNYHIWENGRDCNACPMIEECIEALDKSTKDDFEKPKKGDFPGPGGRVS